MWMVIIIAPMFLGLMGLLAYDTWRNRRIDQYNEWKKQNEKAVA